MKLLKKPICIFMSIIFICSVSRISSEEKTPQITKDKNFMYIVNESDNSATLLKVKASKPVILPSSLDNHNITEVAPQAVLKISDDHHLPEKITMAIFGNFTAIVGWPIVLLLGYFDWELKNRKESFKGIAKDLFKILMFPPEFPTNLDIKIIDKIISANLSYCKKVGERAFMCSSHLTHVNLPQCTELSNSCFTACLNLISINLDEFSGKIPELCFGYCSKLENLNIPDCSAIGKHAFFGCHSIKKINFPNCSEVGEGAFKKLNIMQWFGSTTETIKHPLHYQGKLGDIRWEQPIYNNSPALEEVKLPKCSKIESEAFMKCSNLKTIVCPNVESIGGLAFKDCKSLKSLNFPKASSLGNSCFSGCEALENANLSGCTLIPDFAFGGCTHLKTLSSPELQKVGKGAFINCKSLEEIKIPKSVAISNFAFENCSNLKRLDLPEVKEIGLSAFKNCENLEEVYIPNCTKISSEAFKNCGKLKKVTISSSCEIGQSALPYDKLVSKDFELIRK